MCSACSRSVFAQHREDLSLLFGDDFRFAFSSFWPAGVRRDRTWRRSASEGSRSDDALALERREHAGSRRSRDAAGERNVTDGHLALVAEGR